jgi:hypothetical protein
MSLFWVFPAYVGVSKIAKYLDCEAGKKKVKL